MSWFNLRGIRVVADAHIHGGTLHICRRFCRRSAFGESCCIGDWVQLRVWGCKCWIVSSMNEGYSPCVQWYLPWFLSLKQRTGWSAISSSMRKSRPPSPSENENEFVACVGVPWDAGLATSNIGEISSISFSSSSMHFFNSVTLFLAFSGATSSDAVLLSKLFDGDVSSSNKMSLTAAVIAANFKFCWTRPLASWLAFASTVNAFDCGFGNVNDAAPIDWNRGQITHLSFEIETVRRQCAASAPTYVLHTHHTYITYWICYRWPMW